MTAKKADCPGGRLFEDPVDVERFAKALAIYSLYSGDDPETAERLKADLLAEIQEARLTLPWIFWDMDEAPPEARREAKIAFGDVAFQIMIRLNRYKELMEVTEDDPQDEVMEAWWEMRCYVRWIVGTELLVRVLLSNS